MRRWPDAPREPRASAYELPPREAICPYHYDYGEEERLLVLDGQPTLRTPEGSERLDPLELVFSSATTPTRRCAC